MTDLSIQSFPGAPVADHSWLAGDSAAFDNAQSGTLDVSQLVSGTHYDAVTKIVPSGLALSKSGNLLVPFNGASEVQLLTMTGTPAGGTFTLTFDGETTAAIAYNAAASAIQTALEALSNIEPGDVVVGGASPAWTVTFAGKYTGKNVPQFTANSGSLTGGTSPTLTPTTTTAGGGTASLLDSFLAYPVALLRENGSLSTSVVIPVIVDATIIPANLPVPAQRGINQNTPTTGKFGIRI